jgi:hypothetical protein
MRTVLRHDDEFMPNHVNDFQRNAATTAAALAATMNETQSMMLRSMVLCPSWQLSRLSRRVAKSFYKI